MMLSRDESLESSDYYARMAHNAPYWIGREERWNHNVRCTPVGMRADQASHRLVESCVSYQGDGVIYILEHLEPRT